MQQVETPDSLPASLALCEDKSLTDDGDFSCDITMKRESMLSKAQYFCRIGMGAKSMQSMSSETQRRMTTYFNEKTSQSQEQSLTATPSTSDHTQIQDDEDLPVLSALDPKASMIIDMDENPEEWVKRSLIKKNMLQKAHLLSRMGMGPQSLESMNHLTKARLTRYHREEYDEQENTETMIERGDLNNSVSSSEGDYSFDFVEKTDDEARNCYYDKLIKMKVLKMTPSKKNQSIIIFDWDDTLLCTTYIVALGTRSVAPSVVSVLKPVDLNASRLLDKTTDSGQVFIITNAEEGWVQYSAKVFLPETYKVIMKKEITVISARTCYQEQFPGDSCRWKKEAFTGLMKHFERDIVTNLICIGDSNIEMDAAHVLAKKFDKAIIKTIKFKENPKPEELAKQQHLVMEKFEQIFVSLRNTTIKLEKKTS